MVNATFAYWDQNPLSPEARLAPPVTQQWFVYWRPNGPAELFKPDEELMREANIAVRWVRGDKDEVIAKELGENFDRVKKTRQRFIRLIGLGEYGLEIWRDGKQTESLAHRHRPTREGEGAPFYQARIHTHHDS